MNTHYTKKKLSAAYRYSYSRLALNYYSLYEGMWEEAWIPVDFEEYAGEFHQILRLFLDGKGDLERLRELRNRLTSSVEIFSAYTDCFQIYEYVLNRMERRFVDGVETEEDPEKFTSVLMGYISSSEDTLMMNGRISRVIAQLPVRYTRQKFFELLEHGLSVFIGSGKKELETMLYILRTESMAKLPEHMEQGREELYETLNLLRQADYVHMEKEAYETYMDRLLLASGQLIQEARFYLLLQDLINDLYVLHLAVSEAVMECSERQVMENIVTGVLNQFLEGNTSMIDDGVTELLTELEGIQESAMERYLSYAAPGENRQDKSPDTLRMVDLLLSGSSFVSLDETNEEDPDGGEKVDRRWLDGCLQQLCQELNDVFAGTSKPVVRAIMAKLLSRLPMMFESKEELEAYIMRSLTSCTDPAERETSMELLTQEMVDDYAFL